jgi:hypothetical protein
MEETDTWAFRSAPEKVATCKKMLFLGISAVEGETKLGATPPRSFM